MLLSAFVPAPRAFLLSAAGASALMVLALAARAVPVDDHTILILERTAVASANGVRFELAQAKKHPENPVLSPGHPSDWDGLQVAWPGTVLYDATDHLFRCWYSGLDAVQARRRHEWLAGYAESKDGLHWEKPAVGPDPQYGLSTNRLAPGWEPYPFISTVLENPDKGDRQRKFLSLWIQKDPAHGARLDKTLASSPDGKHWNREKIAYEAGNNERNAFQDICQLLYQPEEKDRNYTVIGYSQIMRRRTWDARMVRNIGVVHGPDFGDLSEGPDPVALAPERGIDEELHFSTVRRIGGLYLMLFESDRFSHHPLQGDLRLAVSADGRHFRRVHPHSALVATGAKGMWDENLLVTSTAAMQEVGDEIWIYYFGVPGVYVDWPWEYAPKGKLRGSFYYPSYLGIAVLPRDRYACAVGSGDLTTFPLTLEPGGLWLNVEGGKASVAALDPSGRVIARGVLGSERAQTVYRRVAWDDGAPAGAVQLKITLGPDTRLYSLRY